LQRQQSNDSRGDIATEEVVEGLRVVELLLAAFFGAATLNVVNHEKFVLPNSAAWTLAPATVFDQDPLANTTRAFSGSLANSFAVALSVFRGEFLCVMRACGV
jgi:hypothetical protein